MKEDSRMSGTRNSNLLGKITVFVFICFFALPAQGKYGGGSGEPNHPYLIYTAEQMNAIGADSNDWDKHFKLMADIDLSGFTGTSFNIIGYFVFWGSPDNKPFTGVFDGNGHTISNFTYSSTGRDGIGLFGYVSGENAEIKDLGLLNPDIDAGTGDYVGSLVGVIWNGTVTNCYVEGGSVLGAHEVGGLLGYNYYGTITNCYSTATVSGNRYVGGLLGRNSGIITNCYSTGSVSGDWYIGGLVGDSWGGKISACYSRANVAGRGYVGGLVGDSYAMIYNCYSIGSVLGTADVGGLVGYGHGQVTGCFWDTQTSGQSTSVGDTGKTTAEMWIATTFTGWGCERVWTIDEGKDYPRLWWENMPGQLITIPYGLYGGGSGDPDDPYLIYTAEQLNTIGSVVCDWDKHFKLMADIDLSSFTGTSFNIIGSNYLYPFTGVFDGNGHTISNFSYTSEGRYQVGFFGYVTGEIKDLGLIAPNVDVGTGSSVGSLVGWLESGTITNCYATGSVSGSVYVGGLVGSNRGIVTNCYATAIVSGDDNVGGLVGNNGMYGGGGTITNCYSTGSVSGKYYVGGLVGLNWSATITNCYSKSDVSGYSSVGGLVGYNRFGTITHCYSTGSASGGIRVGGLVGWNKGSVWASFWDIETSGQTSSDGGTGLPTDEMQMASTFIVWGCEPVWTIDEGNDYPRLVWENMSGEFITVPSDLYGGGAGDPNDPYLIYTDEQLNMIGLFLCDLDKHFKLMADIDLSGYTGTSFNFIGTDYYYNPFSGVFDGNNHKIYNFTYDSNDRRYIGLFGYIRGENAEIKNLGLIDPNVDVGTGRDIGSLVGQLSKGTISGCYVEGGSVSGNENVGGLVGGNGGTITNCYSTATVSGNRYVGGLVGRNVGTITNCYSTSSISANVNVGGLVGTNGYCDWLTCYYGTISNCYSTGSVDGHEYVGGLVGHQGNGEIKDSFWDIETSGQTTSAGGTGKTTTEMQMQVTFTDAGWDFVGESFNGIEDIWFIPQSDYPQLWWEGMQVPMKLTPRTLNCRSYGNWVKAHITLPEGFTVADVDSNRPAVLHSFGFESAPLYVFVNENELVEIEAAFEREALCSLTGDWPEALTVAGFLTDGNIFLGTSTVRIIHPGMKVIEELAWYWLNADCVHPTWCDRIDMNRDSLVNLLDYALLMNIEVEFVTDE